MSLLDTAQFRFRGSDEVQIGPLLLTLQNPVWILEVITCLVKYEKNAYPFPNFTWCTTEVWAWISNIILHFIMAVIMYPCWDFIHVSKSLKLWDVIIHPGSMFNWIRSRRCGCLVTWFCYQLIAKPEEESRTFVTWPNWSLVLLDW